MYVFNWSWVGALNSSVFVFSMTLNSCGAMWLSDFFVLLRASFNAPVCDPQPVSTPPSVAPSQF